MKEWNDAEKKKELKVYRWSEVRPCNDCTTCMKVLIMFIVFIFIGIGKAVPHVTKTKKIVIEKKKNRTGFSSSILVCIPRQHILTSCLAQQGRCC